MAFCLRCAIHRAQLIPAITSRNHPVTASIRASHGCPRASRVRTSAPARRRRAAPPQPFATFPQATIRYASVMLAKLPPLFEASADALLTRLSSHIDDTMLWDIAGADYGRQASEHHAVLRRMRDTGFVPRPDWVPQEVLELIRWSEPDQPDWLPGDRGARGHWMRAFCCAALLRMAGETGDRTHTSFNETVVGLTTSLVALDAAFWREAGTFFAWFIDRMAGFSYRSEEPFVAVALLWCALHDDKIPDAAIGSLCSWIADREEAQAYQGAGAANGHGWLHRLSHHDQRRATWRALGRKMAKLDLQGRSEQARDWVTLIALALAEEL